MQDTNLDSKLAELRDPKYDRAKRILTNLMFFLFGVVITLFAYRYLF